MTRLQRLRRLERAAAHQSGTVSPTDTDRTGLTAEARAASRAVMAEFLVSQGAYETMAEAVATLAEFDAEWERIGSPAFPTFRAAGEALERLGLCQPDETEELIRGAEEDHAEFEAWCRLRQAPPA